MPARFSRKFSKQYDKADSKIKKAFDKRLKIFLQDSFSPVLNNHGLTGQYASYRSINVTGDWRAIFCEQKEAGGTKIVTFVALGTHSQLYK